uniref:Uncharacterized protein n=1 Tax=Peronospora matthiolae TaxID=2874970 RepID=A0AAV1UZE1_9STRA
MPKKDMRDVKALQGDDINYECGLLLLVSVLAIPSDGELCPELMHTIEREKNSREPESLTIQEWMLHDLRIQLAQTKIDKCLHNCYDEATQSFETSTLHHA